MTETENNNITAQNLNPTISNAGRIISSSGINTLTNTNENIQPSTSTITINTIDDDKAGKMVIKCWNCKNIHIVKSNWKVIQCPVCHEVNKVPQQLNEVEELLKYIKASTIISYADKEHTVPLVNYLVVCPYCKTDNQVRETAYHCICYRCKNRWSLRKPKTEREKLEEQTKPPESKESEGNYYKYDSKTGMVLPPDKPLRFSDLFYPDPAFYPGYYPINSLSPLYPEYFNPYDDYRYVDRQMKMMKYNSRIQREKHTKLNNNLDLDKYLIMNKLSEIEKKADKMMENRITTLKNEHGVYNRGVNLNELAKSSDKVKSYENMFFMKK